MLVQEVQVLHQEKPPTDLKGGPCLAIPALVYVHACVKYAEDFDGQCLGLRAGKASLFGPTRWEG